MINTPLPSFARYSGITESALQRFRHAVSTSVFLCMQCYLIPIEWRVGLEDAVHALFDSIKMMREASRMLYCQ